MSICTVRESNWSICIKMYSAITIKHFFSKRCTSTASKTETVTCDSKILESGMLRRFDQFFKNVPRVTVTVKDKWETCFGFWTIKYIFVANRKSISWRCSKNQNFLLEMTTEYMLQYMLLFLRETKKHIKKKHIKTASKYLIYVIKLLSILWKH